MVALHPAVSIHIVISWYSQLSLVCSGYELELCSGYVLPTTSVCMTISNLADLKLWLFYFFLIDVENVTADFFFGFLKKVLDFDNDSGSSFGPLKQMSRIMLSKQFN